MSRHFDSEEKLAERVVAWLREFKWDVFQEVAASGGRADIVARMGRVIWVIECKNSFTLDLIEQAVNWKRFAHKVSVAYPDQYRGSPLRTEICEWQGIGCLEVGLGVHERGVGILNRRADTSRWNLTDEHRDYAKAGNAHGDYWSDWKRFQKSVREFVAIHPGCSVKELVAGIKHHYASPASARSSLTKFIEQGVIKGIRGDRGASGWRVFLHGAPAEELS